MCVCVCSVCVCVCVCSVCVVCMGVIGCVCVCVCVCYSAHMECTCTFLHSSPPPPPLLPKVLAILTFSLTADYSPSASRNSIQCNGLSLSIGASYPYDSSSFSFSSNSSNVTCKFSTEAFSGSAQYFVGMGVLTFLYLVLAVAAYVLLVNTLFAYAHYILIAVSKTQRMHARRNIHA